ncbi:MAG: hypothetical protein RIT45_2876 [Pseudomonadota bacterium]
MRLFVHGPSPVDGTPTRAPLWPSRRIGAGALLLAIMVGCGADDKGGTDAGTDSVLPLFDSGGGGVEFDAAGTDADTVETKEGCPGAADCNCVGNADCDSALCMAYADGKRCARLCVDGGCLTGEVCVPVQTGTDTITACAPVHARLCDPCDEDNDCNGAGITGGVCVDRGPAGAFCGTACEGDTDCPQGYACGDVNSLGGTAAKQCVPKDEALCTCSPAAIAKELSTACAVQGEGGASCPGKRACLADGKSDAPAGGGLSACLGKAPGPEVCDGSDNDCDGSTDEGIDGCDDGNPCTIDTCDQSLGCVHNPSAAGCDDGDACTAEDACVKSGTDVVCQGKAIDCDDNDACTTDACDATAGCTHTASGGACDDGDPCTDKDVCGEGGCAGTATDCDDGNPCTADSCDVTSGTCTAVPVAGASCDDGDVCTAGDACADLGAGVVGCAGGVTSTCDDGNSCTTDACDSVTGCTNTANIGQMQSCYDGPQGTQDIGTCVAGIATCQANGSLGACTGAVKPNPNEACDGFDDDCDGSTDEGCNAGPVKVHWRFAGASLAGASGEKKVRALTGVSGVGGTWQGAGGNKSVGVGFLQALRAFGL